MEIFDKQEECMCGGVDQFLSSLFLSYSILLSENTFTKKRNLFHLVVKKYFVLTDNVKFL